MIPAAFVGSCFAPRWNSEDQPGNRSKEIKRSLSLNLEARDERYVRREVEMGLFVGHIKPVLVDNAVGQKGIKKTRDTGE